MAENIRCKYDDEVCPYYDDETKEKDKICLECKIPDLTDYQGKRHDQVESSCKIFMFAIVGIIVIAVVGVVSMFLSHL